ncbi:hypothetical protein HBB16_19215 [Pseudonocardia sp. MCCB 268]|nr:hypothetical protein [Pseudonocardia cytotoxica]
MLRAGVTPTVLALLCPGITALAGTDRRPGPCSAPARRNCAARPAAAARATGARGDGGAAR